MRRAGHVARMWARTGAYVVWVGKLEGRRLLGRPRRRLEDNIKMDIREADSGYGLNQSGSR
jgi:RNase P/RNase MRP subunit p29